MCYYVLLWKLKQANTELSTKNVEVVINLCMEAMLGISLCSFSYLKLAKMLCLILSLMFSLQQNWRRGQNRVCLERSEEEGVVKRGAGTEGRGGPNNVYTYE
jgi:hypothetical protein